MSLTTDERSTEYFWSVGSRIGLDAGVQRAVHGRQLELVVEIRERPDAPDDHPDAVPLRVARR